MNPVLQILLLSGKYSYLTEYHNWMYMFYWLWEFKIKIPNDLLDIIWSSLECAAVGELAEFLGETFEVLLGFLKLFVLLIVCGCRERQAIPDPNH